MFLIESMPYGRDVNSGIVGATASTGRFNDGANYPFDNSISDRHGNGASIGFLDWHVENYDFNTYTSQLSLSPGPFWCNPDTANGQ